MEKVDKKDLKKKSHKLGLLFILQLSSLLFTAPILFNLGFYNTINMFILNNLVFIAIACILFSCDFKKMFLKKSDINILEAIFYIFFFFSLYLILTSLINNLLPFIYNVKMEEADAVLKLFIIGGIAIPIAEEIVYRGILLEALRKYGDLFAVFVSALIFGMLHLSKLPHTFLAGIFMGILYVRSNNLIYPILMHIFNNLFFSSFVFWVEDAFNTNNMNLASLISLIICIFIASILYIILKKKNSREVENIRISKVKEIFERFKEDSEKRKIFFNTGTVIISLVLYFLVLSAEVNMILSNLK